MGSTDNPGRFAGRRDKLVSKLRKLNCDSILITNETNVTYLTGFSGDSSYVVLGPDLCVIVSDNRYRIQLGNECPDIDHHIRPVREDLNDAVAKVLRKANVQKLGFESGSITHSAWEQLRDTHKTIELVATSSVVEELRQIKDAGEIAEIRAAVDQAQRGFALIKASLRADQTELEVAHDLEHAMRRFGGLQAAFDPIVAVGPQAALPHAHPGDQRISDDNILLVDWGSRSRGGYLSDLTRVLVTGRLAAKLEKVYRLVLKAQLAAIDAIRPGAKCSDVDAIARKVIADGGYGKYFQHGLGHGIGLDIHEWPRFSPTSEDELKPGMVMTVEPGIYLPGWGGVRIEDDVLITRQGHEVLSSFPKELADAICS